MLFRKDTLDAIAVGRVSLAFRRWHRPRVKVGTRLRTQVGELEVLDVTTVDLGEITDADLDRAGVNRSELTSFLADRSGEVYRIEVRLAGPDSRIALRADDDLDETDLAELTARLDRMDRAAPEPWTWVYLKLIAAHPGRVSTELAQEVGIERPRFKQRVRRLKELGLTESLEVGYRISPRGEALLRRHPKGNAG